MSVLPALGPSRSARRPATAERVLESGLRVLAVRRAGVPLIELRLRIPFAGRTVSHRARASLLSSSMLMGTADRSELDLAHALQEVGTELSVSTDSDRLLIGGVVLRAGLASLLDLLAELLTAASYPSSLVDGERQQLIEHLQMARTQPDVIARVARAKRLFGEHAYGRVLPGLDDVAAQTATTVRRLHRDRVQPDGSTLVLVGDLSPARTVEAVERVLSVWSPGAAPVTTAAVPKPAVGPALLVDRPGSVQSSLRLAGASCVRTDPGYPAMQLANLIFGGYFSSRYVENIREDKGYTYTPRSSIDHRQVGSSFYVDADVSTNVTAPALLETRYELGRMATLPVGQEELDNARQYALGNLALSTATQAGLAGMLSGLAGHGLGLDWLAAYRRRLLGVTVDDVFEQSRTYLAPAKLITVVVGDATAVHPDLAALGEVEVG